MYIYIDIYIVEEGRVERDEKLARDMDKVLPSSPAWLAFIHFLALAIVN